MTPLTILLISDGRPGHYHLSEGVVAAIARRRFVHVERLEVRRRRSAPGRVLAGLLAMGARRTVLRLGYGLGASQIPAADIVVSAGGDTVAANAAVAGLRG
ncbi:MAG TPA: nucleoside-diphosphate sugar epimerase, partial [Hyphomicrobiaceae bacterium]|nr:nucleoside-diphosphate sugar epimerase [Hyphomicrobiaceae bacterium]